MDVTPQKQQEAFQAFFKSRFPAVALKDYADGPYPFDDGMKRQWQDIMQLPPFEPAIEEGKTLYETPFADEKTYAGCLPHGGLDVRQTYPRFDSTTGQVETLEIALNACRAANGEAPLPYERGQMASLVAYLASTSYGSPIAVAIPEDARAVAAYAKGRASFYTPQRAGGATCAGCHVDGAGHHADGKSYAPAFGILASFPIYRSEWGEMGTIDRRLIECSRAMGGPVPVAQDESLRDLEYFLSFMSNGVPIAGPGARP